MSAAQIDGFSKAFTVNHRNHPMQIYARGTGDKCVIVMHELPGMTNSFIDFCRRLADAGFKVYMPLLFKEPGTEMGKAATALFCLSGEFRRLFSVESSNADRPITKLLAEMLEKVGMQNPNAKMAAIGMCLTGGFALGAIINDKVKAAVLCQPSYPFATKIHMLGFSGPQIKCIKERAEAEQGTLAKGYRYAGDFISR
ncbi:MAG: dienelactone hydrolase family protein, partial [Pseudomonadota bacterium]